MDALSASGLVAFLQSKLEVTVLTPMMPIQDAIELADFLSNTTKLIIDSCRAPTLWAVRRIPQS
jgi:hypothetical protein